MRCGVLFLCCLMGFGSAWGQSCYNIFTPEIPKIKLLVKSSQLNRLFNRNKIAVHDQAWLNVIHKIGQFEHNMEHNFSVETQKLSLSGTATYHKNTLQLKISFLSTTIKQRLIDLGYEKRFKKSNFDFMNSSLLRFGDYNTNHKAPLKEVVGFINSLSAHIKEIHPHIEKIELTADSIHNKRLYKKLKALDFQTDVPFFKYLVPLYYTMGNLALYSYLTLGTPNLSMYEIMFISGTNALIYIKPTNELFRVFLKEGASLKLTIPLVEGDNSRPDN